MNIVSKRKENVLIEKCKAPNLESTDILNTYAGRSPCVNAHTKNIVWCPDDSLNRRYCESI